MIATGWILLSVLAAGPNEDSDRQAFLEVLTEIDGELANSIRDVSSIKAACANLEHAGKSGDAQLATRFVVLFPVLPDETPKICETKTEAQSSAMLRAAQASLLSLRRCATTGNWSAAACQKFIADRCATFASDDQGNLRVVDLEPDATVVERVLEGPDVVFGDEHAPEGAEQAWSLWGRKVFWGCRLASVSRPLKASNFTRYPRDFPWIGRKTAYGIENLVEACVEDFDAPFRGRALSLVADYPKSFIAKGWSASVSRSIAQCVRVASEVCASVRTVRGVGVLDYATKGCSIRSVTAKDVEEDAARWREYGGMTEADSIEHLLLADTIRVCREMEQAGYFWRYVRPKVDPGCKPAK